MFVREAPAFSTTLLDELVGTRLVGTRRWAAERAMEAINGTRPKVEGLACMGWASRRPATAASQQQGGSGNPPQHSSRQLHGEPVMLRVDVASKAGCGYPVQWWCNSMCFFDGCDSVGWQCWQVRWGRGIWVKRPVPSVPQCVLVHICACATARLSRPRLKIPPARLCPTPSGAALPVPLSSKACSVDTRHDRLREI